jgi:hypothetical protein
MTKKAFSRGATAKNLLAVSRENEAFFHMHGKKSIFLGAEQRARCSKQR